MPRSSQYNIISIAIITYNEELNIGDCIDSASELGPITIVDSGSSDRTEEIAKAAGTQVLYKQWTNFSTQKQYAVNHCISEWVLVLDADERLTPPLIDELKGLSLDDPSVAYAIPRRTFFLGKEVKHSGWTPDYVTRLFNKNHCKFNGRAVHETAIGFTQLKKLKNALLHYSYQLKSEIDAKIDQYSDLGAQTISAKRTYIPSVECFLRASWIFFKTLFIKLGFLDGKTGVAIAVMNFRSTYLKYKKARVLLGIIK